MNQQYRSCHLRSALTASLLCATILCPAASGWAQRLSGTPNTQEPPDTIALHTEVVSLPVTVTDKKGRLYEGLDSRAFTVYEEGIAQELSFFSLADGPATVGIVFDISHSMKGVRMTRARKALAHFVATSHPEDEYALIVFNDRPRLLLEGSNDEHGLLRATDKLEPEGSTALYDAMAMALEQVQQGRYAKRAIIVISDGDDNHSNLSYRQLRRLVREAGVTVFGVLISRFISDRDWMMEELATVSGGAAFYPDKVEEMYETFEQIALQLRQHYSLGYLPANFRADGKWRKLKVKVTRPPGAPKLVVRSRTGYFARVDHARRERSNTELGNK